MKLAIIGSRGLWVEDLGAYLPPGVTELVSGGAKGIDTCAREYALSHGLKLTEFLPDYRRYGRAAPLVRNRKRSSPMPTRCWPSGTASRQAPST